MKGSFRQSMTWLHTWTGLVVAWVLFFVFVTGTASFANYELTRWMQPERPMQAQQTPPAAEQFSLAYQYLQNNPASAKAESWNINLVSDSRTSTALSAGWSEPAAPGERRGKSYTEYLDEQSGEVQQYATARETAGGRALLRMHFALQYMSGQTAFIIVGICTMFMFVAIITGVVAHKKILQDFFTFRHSKGLRSWLDGHNLVSVAALPFFIMITYSGLMFFLYTYMPLGVPLTYGFDDSKELAYYEQLTNETGSSRVQGFGPGGGQGRLTELRRAVAEQAPPSQPQNERATGGQRPQSGEPDAGSSPDHSAQGRSTQGRDNNSRTGRAAREQQTLLAQSQGFTDLAAIVNAVEQQWGPGQVRSVSLRAGRGNSAAEMTLSPAYMDTVLRGRSIGNRLFNAVSGEEIMAKPEDLAAAETFARAMLGMHEGLFAGPLLRWLYLFSGLLGCAMIATGLVLWTVKRRPKLAKTGEYALLHALVEKLNIATIAGFSLALAGYFWANRLLPVDMADRADWEVHSLFILWLATLLYSLLRPVMPAWRELLAATALAWLALPLLNMLTTERHLFASISQGDWVLASVDLSFIALGAMFGWALLKLENKRKKVAAKPARPARSSAAATTDTLNTEVTP